ncbi:hypothetical protein [Actinomadura livida]|uniref:Uncharacterized protein n=1 Tax=Actinomadura livida TaxID=79909 RepID=A0A7W7IHH1_9ACTN|nr:MULTISPECIES: hypothetical protein [Actinomadura]MBB4777193.1 hypothetical protein [Actinomadura catellatispora]GGU20985.1 hypothetical protein GCM10010208_52530 [Actinomadura livida]
MITKIEKLGDRLLSLVVPRATASAICSCKWLGACTRTTDEWRCIYGMYAFRTCCYANPCQATACLPD